MGNMATQFSSGVTAPRSGKREVGIQDLLHWAFQREHVQLDFDEFARETGAKPGIGMEWIMIEQARLGCRVDGGGRSDPHHDAELVASALQILPESVGGRRMALWIAELARLGAVPDCGQGMRAQCQPVEWRGSKHGQYGMREYNRDIQSRWPLPSIAGKQWGYVCPVIYAGTAASVAAARRNYLQWYGALLLLRNTFQIYTDLTSFLVSDQMPPRTPWTAPEKIS